MPGISEKKWEAIIKEAYSELYKNAAPSADFDEEEYRFMLENLDGKFVRLPLAMFNHKEIEIQGTIFDDEFREEYAIHNRLE